MIARKLLVILFVLAGLVFSATPVVACTCQAYPPTELAAVSEVVFTGVARAYLDQPPTSDSAIVEFQVNTLYKGPLVPRIQVQALGARGWSALGPGCGWGLHLGVRYTIFAIDYDKDGVPNTNGCLQPVAGPIDPATYGLASGQTPPQTDEGLPLSIVAGFAIVALAVISIVIARRRPATP